MTSITWASLRYVQELTTILGPQNRTQGSCDMYDAVKWGIKLVKGYSAKMACGRLWKL